MNYKKAVENIRQELKSYVQKNNLKSLVIGISGGIDSALCAVLAKPVCDELKIPLIGASLPIFTNKPDEINRAKLTGDTFCTNFKQENLEELYNKLSIINPNPSYEYVEAIDKLNLSDKDNDKAWKIRNGNIKTRLRMIYLYNLASTYNGMVLSTDNWTEYLLGFWTLHGDVGDYSMIQELWKTEVYDMAEYLIENELKINTPHSIYNKEGLALKSCIEAQATDGLGISDLGDLGQILPEWRGSSRDGYKEVDRILQIWTEVWKESNKKWQIIKAGYGNHPVVQRHLKSKFKRQIPISIKRNVIFEN